MTYVNCLYCKAPIRPDDPNTYRRVVAWERRSLTPSRRSGSDLVLREQAKPEEFLLLNVQRPRRAHRSSARGPHSAADQRERTVV